MLSDFQRDSIKSSRSTADLLTESLGLLTGLGLLELEHLIQAFERVCYAGLLHKLKSYEISSRIFGLVSSFLM